MQSKPIGMASLCGKNCIGLVYLVNLIYTYTTYIERVCMRKRSLTGFRNMWNEWNGRDNQRALCAFVHSEFAIFSVHFSWFLFSCCCFWVFFRRVCVLFCILLAFVFVCLFGRYQFFSISLPFSHSQFHPFPERNTVQSSFFFAYPHRILSTDQCNKNRWTEICFSLSTYFFVSHPSIQSCNFCCFFSSLFYFYLLDAYFPHDILCGIYKFCFGNTISKLLLLSWTWTTVNSAVINNWPVFAAQLFGANFIFLPQTESALNNLLIMRLVFDIIYVSSLTNACIWPVEIAYLTANFPFLIRFLVI